MRFFTRSILGLLALALLMAVGCQQHLNEQRDIHVTPGTVKLVSIDGPSRQQKINVEVTSSAPVDVYIVLSSGQEAEDKMLDGKRLDPSNVLASKDQVENATLDATVPAKNRFCVVVKNAKKAADVKLKITGG